MQLTVVVGADNRDVLVVCTVVIPPHPVLTIVERLLVSGTDDVVQPDTTDAVPISRIGDDSVTPAEEVVKQIHVLYFSRNFYFEIEVNIFFLQQNRAPRLERTLNSDSGYGGHLQKGT